MSAMSETESQSALSFDSEHRLRSENLAWDIDVWYPKIKEYTFPTIFLPLRVKEAKAIKAFHDFSWRHCQEELSSEEITTLQQLEADVTATISAWECYSSKGVFMRLCGRSPKDGEPLKRDGVLQAYDKVFQELLSQLDHEPTGLALANLKMNAIAKISWLRVHDGRDAMSLLLSSERTLAEMIDWLRYGEPEQLCFRVWEDQLTIDYEFRLFIHAGELVAISQYDHYAYYPHVHMIKDKLELGLRDLWSRVHPRVSELNSSYVMDIAYLPTSDTYIVVELNPFSPCTGAALFSWSADKHMLEGNGPFEFRLKVFENLHPQLDEVVELNWNMRWKQEVKPYWEYYHQSASTSTASLSLYQRMSNFWMGSIAKSVVSEPVIAITPSTMLFVYGTLKRGFQWNGKYLAPRLGGKYLYDAKTVDAYALVIGDSGVPYLLTSATAAKIEYDDSQMKRVVGELWSVEEETLHGLDDYEGVNKGYYQRISIKITTCACHAQDKIVDAFVYVLTLPTDSLREKETIEEYTLEMHEQLYKPVRHIQRKQFAYFNQPSSWGKVNAVIDGSVERPES